MRAKSKIKTKAKANPKAKIKTKVKAKVQAKSKVARKPALENKVAKSIPSKGLRAKTLVQAWLEVELVANQRSLAEALRDLNKALGSAHTHSRVREWEDQRGGRGDRLPRELRLYMAKRVIKHVLSSAGIQVKGVKPVALVRVVEQLC